MTHDRCDVRMLSLGSAWPTQLQMYCAVGSNLRQVVRIAFSAGQANHLTPELPPHEASKSWA